jgi:hypothetical protein
LQGELRGAVAMHARAMADAQAQWRDEEQRLIDALAAAEQRRRDDAADADRRLDAAVRDAEVRFEARMRAMLAAAANDADDDVDGASAVAAASTASSSAPAVTAAQPSSREELWVVDAGGAGDEASLPNGDGGGGGGGGDGGGGGLVQTPGDLRSRLRLAVEEARLVGAKEASAARQKEIDALKAQLELRGALLVFAVVSRGKSSLSRSSCMHVRVGLPVICVVMMAVA